ncbi:hypothetical protein BDU57DRAFT_498083 [Ampelomyces quisqualis]|uniref:HIT-type domain-containing protein n=1 Tax=Ampelomyces quisqualis TaxID=50730 RepID=A0A6A5QNK4_AMPQU|nr:hypothetical protein BDU57DRAFT_498083 [Ampelomyces quisqualis]
MSDPLCGVCAAEPKKYKCPTCALPYCSIPCFKLHKTTHPEPTTPAPQPSAELALPQPPPPAPIPRYLRRKTDFSVLAADPKFRGLLKLYPTLLPALQRVYAATIEPDPEDERRRRMTRGGFRGRGTRGRGIGRGRGPGGFDDREGKWTQKKGDADGMSMLKGLRHGNAGGKDQEAMAAFVGLVDEIFGAKEKVEEG